MAWPPAPVRSAEPITGLTQVAVEIQLQQLAQIVSGDARSQLDRLRADRRAGRDYDIRGQLHALRTDNMRWPFLNPEVKGEWLRTEAIVSLQETGSVAEAHLLLAEIQALGPATDTIYLQALISYIEGDRQRALELLADAIDSAGHNLKAGIFIELERLAEADAVLDAPDPAPDTDTFRLRAISQLARGNLAPARAAIQQALALAPDSQDIHFIEGQIQYLAGISPVSVPRHLQFVPEPLDPWLVKGNAAGTASLQAALDTFSQLSAQERLPLRALAEIWRLACLSNIPARREEAEAYCQHLLAEDPARAEVVLWAVTRRFDINYAASEQALVKLVTAVQRTPLQMLALAEVYQRLNNPHAARQLLAQQQAVFHQQQMHDAWAQAYLVALLTADEDAAAQALIDSLQETPTWPQSQVLLLEKRARQDGNWQSVFAHLEAHYAANDLPDTGALTRRCAPGEDRLPAERWPGRAGAHSGSSSLAGVGQHRQPAAAGRRLCHER